MLYANTPVTAMEAHRELVRVDLANGRQILAGAKIVATNSPISHTVTVHTKQALYRTDVFAAPVPRGSVADGLLWDTDEPYPYARIQPRERADFVIVGGEDHRTGTPDKGARCIQRLYEEWARGRWSAGPIECA